jgi:hypothetical protein
VVEPGPRTAEAAALRAPLARIVRLMLEVIGGRRPAGQLAALAEARVVGYLRRIALDSEAVVMLREQAGCRTAWPSWAIADRSAAWPALASLIARISTARA